MFRAGRLAGAFAGLVVHLVQNPLLDGETLGRGGALRRVLRPSTRNITGDTMQCTTRRGFEVAHDAICGTAP